MENVGLPTFPIIFYESVKLWLRLPKFLQFHVQPTFSLICLRGIMENVGFTNISNNFYDYRNYGSGSGGFSKIMETV